MAEFLESQHRGQEFPIVCAVVVLRRGQGLGVESHWRPALVVVLLLDEHGSDVGGRGIGDKLDLGCGARMLQCCGVYQSLLYVLKSFILGLSPTKNSIKSVNGCMSMAALGIQALKKLTRPVKRAISSLFSGRRVCTDCFGMFVIGPQTRTGDVEAEEVEVLLVERGLSHVDGRRGGASRKPPSELIKMFSKQTRSKSSPSIILSVNLL